MRTRSGRLDEIRVAIAAHARPDPVTSIDSRAIRWLRDNYAEPVRSMTSPSSPG
ncbi:hypothetical protein [Saccharothrix longispora]|uniref:hypothetical protein n=1 Tax=Saccharothrix longispora TaxID=33920 RepID=UPI0028FD47B9|nr:hypothetical protein [Saccharothrix longispora]MDU0290042.1 hypothetical protein [Saccharothrix longispora]